MNNKPLPIVHDRRELAAGDMLRVEQVELEFPNGERRTYSRMKARGLGAVIMDGRTLSRTDLAIVGMIVIGVLGFLTDRLIVKLNNRMLRWSPQHHE